MIKIENVEVSGFKPALRGMRNPLNSWEKADSYFDEGIIYIGPNDNSLAERLFKAGTEHRKYMRMIVAWMDITAPLYWWKEFDTYKVGTVANSCSTMHKIQAKEFTIHDFSHEHLKEAYLGDMYNIVYALNKARDMYLKTKDKEDWWQMIQLLPSTYNQKRTVMFNYEVAATMIRQRTGHKLDEWNEFVKELNNLPHIQDFMKIEENN